MDCKETEVESGDSQGDIAQVCLRNVLVRVLIYEMGRKNWMQDCEIQTDKICL